MADIAPTSVENSSEGADKASSSDESLSEGSGKVSSSDERLFEGSGCFSTSVGVSGEYSIGSSEYSVVKVNFFLWVI